jgi:hypothetical protein
VPPNRAARVAAPTRIVSREFTEGKPEGRKGIAGSYFVMTPPRCFHIAFVVLPRLSLARPLRAAAPPFFSDLLVLLVPHQSSHLKLSCEHPYLSFDLD